MLIRAGADGFGFGRGTFIPNGSELDRAGSLALFAPVSLRTVEAFPHPAIIANENFFSHANLVSTSGSGLCQALFSAAGRVGSRWKGASSRELVTNGLRKGLK
jgi:hypothetical protein